MVRVRVPVVGGGAAGAAGAAAGAAAEAAAGAAPRPTACAVPRPGAWAARMNSDTSTSICAMRSCVSSVRCKRTSMISS